MDFLAIGQQSLRTVAHSLEMSAQRMGSGFLGALDALVSRPGRLVVCGVGKSGLVGQKIAATFSSLGKPAFFLHPTEAVHGDIGAVCAGDVALLISNSGSTELVALLPFLRQREIVVIALTGRMDSPLAEGADWVIDAGVDAECDAHRLIPTASTSVALALGDALAVGYMEARQMSPDAFALNHPGGQLGRNLCMRVEDVMQPLARVAVVGLHASMRDVVIALTDRPQGAALVLNDAGHLEGIVTDGDVRRALQRWDDVFALDAKAFMTPNPLTVGSRALLMEAVDLMEGRARQISVLPVLGGHGETLGLLRIHDVYPHRA